jgi:hypothetical protein
VATETPGPQDQIGPVSANGGEPERLEDPAPATPAGKVALAAPPVEEEAAVTEAVEEVSLPTESVGAESPVDLPGALELSTPGEGPDPEPAS